MSVNKQIPADSGSITSLRITKRVYNCLINMGITEVEEVARVSAEDLLRLKNISKKSVQNLEEALASRGLRLATKFHYAGEPMCEEDWQSLLGYVEQLAELEVADVAQ
jgi:DNA-directed RNA polymerase alpha subunit